MRNWTGGWNGSLTTKKPVRGFPSNRLNKIPKQGKVRDSPGASGLKNNHLNSFLIMKQVFSSIIILFAAMALAFKSAITTHEVDTNPSIVTWTGYKVTGQHTGTVKIKKGTITLTDGILTGGMVEIDMTSLKDTDLDGEWATKLENHLKSEDFFGTAHFPTSKFELTRALPQDSKGNYKLIGNLTIKETTKEVKCFGNLSQNGSTMTLKGKLTIDRSEFNVRYGSGSFFDGLGDKTIYDEFDLQFNLVTR